MKSLLKKLICFILLLCIITFANATEKRVALVIANQDYANFTPLKSSKSSASVVKSFLEKQGFEVKYYENLTIASMQNAIDTFNGSINEESIALIYYQGLSLLNENQDYLLMVDSQKDQKNISAQAINLQNLVHKLKTAKLTIAIANINRNDSLTRAVKIYPKNLFLAFSTQSGTINEDSDKFANFFVRYAKEDLEINEVFKNVQKEMAKATDNKQVPTIISSKTDDFFFTLPK